MIPVGKVRPAARGRRAPEKIGSQMKNTRGQHQNVNQRKITRKVNYRDNIPARPKK
jgi:hypothetical protein